MVKQIIGMILLLAVGGCATHKGLGVKLGPPEYYRNEKGDRFVARHGQLSDESLRFVKVTMPNGHEYTLPQVISASGVRYTDERDFVWWEHQGTVRVDVRGADGGWATEYSELKPAPKNK